MYKTIFRILLFAFLFSVFVMLWGVSTVEASLPATVTRTPTPTPTKINNTFPPLDDSLILMWGGGGGGRVFFDPGTFSGTCYHNKEMIKSTPAVLTVGDNPADYGHICLYGFKLGDPITITFRNPNIKTEIVGTFNASKEDVFLAYRHVFILQTMPSLGDVMAGDIQIISDAKGEQTITDIVFWKPMGVPEGIWEVTVKSGDIQLKTKMNVGWDKTDPRVGWVYQQPSVLGRAPIIIHMGLGSRKDAICQTANSEEKKTFQALNLKPNQYYKIGVYVDGVVDQKESTRTLNLIDEYTILTDKLGSLKMDFSANQKDIPKMYYISRVFDPYANQYVGAEDDQPGYDAPVNDCIYVKWKACPNAPQSGLQKGGHVYINRFSATPSNLRARPGVSGEKVGKLTFDDQNATIIDGPRCMDNMVWWRIRTDSGLAGWAAEGLGNEVWLVPWQ
jgi:hypothetical protein